jgi:hypothetical protein
MRHPLVDGRQLFFYRLGKTSSSYQDSPALCRSMRIPPGITFTGCCLRLYWLAAEGVDPGLMRRPPIDEVSEFVHAAFSDTERKDRAEMTSLVPQARSDDGVAFSV